MLIGTGTFDGRNDYILNGTFTLTQLPLGRIAFETSDDFFFGNAAGTGTPAPGFALFSGDPTSLPSEVVDPVAAATDFLRISDQATSVSGPQSGLLSEGISLSEFDTVFLWCFKFPVVLGIGTIVSRP